MDYYNPYLDPKSPYYNFNPAGGSPNYSPAGGPNTPTPYNGPTPQPGPFGAPPGPQPYASGTPTGTPTPGWQAPPGTPGPSFAPQLQPGNPAPPTPYNNPSPQAPPFTGPITLSTISSGQREGHGPYQDPTDPSASPSQGAPPGWDPSIWQPGQPWYAGVPFPGKPGQTTGPNPGQINFAPGSVPPGSSTTTPGPNGPVTQTPGTGGNPPTASYGTPATPPPTPGGSGGGGGAPGSLGDLLHQPDPMYSPLTGTPTSWTPIPNAPTFAAPTFAQAQSDPGYRFAEQQGEQALQQSQAAQGLSNTGGSLKDILAWGQNYAAQRYQDVYNRDLNTWEQTQYQPWQTQAGLTAAQNQFLTNAKFQAWLAQWNNFKDQRNAALTYGSG